MNVVEMQLQSIFDNNFIVDETGENLGLRKHSRLAKWARASITRVIVLGKIKDRLKYWKA